MKLITETNNELEILQESLDEGKKKNYTIRGIFLQGSVKNKNGRMYPQELLDERVQRYIDSHVVKNRALGELGHPPGPTMNLDKVSHRITKLYKDNNNWIGEAKIMDTPMGKIVKNLIDEGVQIGVSSRGLGTVKRHPEGYNVVNDDFHLVTAADIVADPSAPDAFVEGIMEGKEWVMIGDSFKEVNSLSMEKILEETQNDIEDIVQATLYLKEARQEALIKALNEYFSKIKF